MMEDWTDIIGEELENIEEPLPADDWSVLQQKYAAAQKRKKAAAFAWAGGITSVAAAVALVLLLVRPDASPVISYEIASVIPDLITDSDTNVLVDVVKNPVDDVLFAENRSTDTPPEPKDESLSTHVEEVQSGETEVVFDVIRDTTSLREKLLADASSADNRDCESEQISEMPDFDDYQGMKIRSVPSLSGRRRLISIGLSGSTSDSPILKAFDMGPTAPPMDSGPSDIPEDGCEPDDSLGTGVPEPTMSLMKAKSAYVDFYEHEHPVSVGVSARLSLTDRLSVNTGLNYTRYASTRTRSYNNGSYRFKAKQRVHYLGIPVRFDYMAVNREHFNMYLGAGVQMDKCIYATVGGDRLHEKQFLFGVNGALGFQVNVATRVGLYFEPEVSYALNEGSIETFRSDEPFVVTVRGGLRFSF